MRLYELFKREPVDQSLPYDEADPYDTIEYHRTRGDKWAGPHEGRYITLMLAGKKPATLLDEVELKYYEKYIVGKNFGMHRFSIRIGGRPGPTDAHPQVVLTLPGQEWRGPKIEKLFDRREDYWDAGKESLWHARIGMLLGYSNEDIRKFITQG